jgi:acyl carrier protein
MKDTVIEVLNEVLRENGHAPFPFTEATNIFRETAIDSLALAVVLVKLEERVGRDPFAGGFVSFSTVAELVRLYEHA